MEKVCIKVLSDIQRELEGPELNLQNVYNKWTGSNFDKFALAISKLEIDRYISIPDGDIVPGGDSYIPVDIIINNIRITQRGKNLLRKQGLI